MSDQLPAWVTLMVAAAGSLIGGGVAYGVLSTRLAHVERRVDEKASKESHDSLREYLDARFTAVEQLIRGVVR